jgi:hypothetical protein
MPIMARDGLRLRVGLLLVVTLSRLEPAVVADDEPRPASPADPHAVAVDAGGKVVACGRLEDVLARARDLVNKGR